MPEGSEIDIRKHVQFGVAGVIGSFFTVADVSKIITLWPRHERRSNSWKINGRIRAHCMGFLATLILRQQRRGAGFHRIHLATY